MKIKFPSKNALKSFAVALLFSFLGFKTAAQAPVIQTFSFTGSQQTFTVPSCVASITIDARGAAGAQSNDRVPTNSTGGLGGRALGVLSVVAGQVLYINVGGVGNINGTGGFNGGGLAGVSTAGGSCFGGSAGGGGGASDVRLGGTALANRVIVGGGGGGSGRDYCNGSCQPCGCGGSGGGGGGATGVVGIAANNCGFGYPGANTNGGVGGSGTAGGAGGIGDAAGPNGTAGTLGVGGVGGAGTLDVSGGGGGGGFYGGGGGGSASSGSGVGGGGGGGGSSYIAGLTAASTTSSFQTGNGVVILTYDFNGTLAQVNTVPGNTLCLGTTATVTASNLNSYTWTPGNSNVISFTVTPTTNTSYTVTGTNNLGCNSQAVVNLVVIPAAPVLTVVNTASATGGICPNSTVALTASGAATYSWTNGVTNSVTFGPTNSATYVVSGQNACGTTTAATSISVHALPNVTAIASQPTICSGNTPVSVSGVGNAVTYSVVNPGIPHAVNFFPPATAIYTIVGTSAQSCTNSALVGVTVVPSPLNPPLASPPLICIGSSATLSSSGATTYSWISSSAVVSGSLINVTPTVTTSYTLTKSNANCVNSQVIQVFVNQLPSLFAIASPTLICASNPATLQAAGAQTYTWSAAGPPTFTVTGASPIVSPSLTTLYTVAASDGTCANTTTVLLTTNPNPTISIVPTSTNICQGDAVSLTASGAIGYSWTTSSIVSNTNAITITETPTAPIVYQVTGVNNFNCTTNAQVVVLVRTTPTLQISTQKPLVCIGGASGLTVTAQAGPCTYTWGANAGNVTSSVVVVNPLTSTVYSVVGRAANQCTATMNYPVSVFQPSFTVNTPTSSCLGGTINLIASGANTYTWNGTQPFSQISVSPSSATFYIVAATSSSNNVNCVSTNTVFVTIYSNPTVTAVPSRTQICRGEFTDINGGGALTYTLNTGLSGSLIPVNPINNTTYTLTGTDQNGCTNTVTVTVRTSICFGIDELNKMAGVGLMIYPNPNSGNFTVKAADDLQLQLINELGQIVRIIDLNQNNAHQIQVSDLSNGIYFITGKKGEVSVREKIVIQK